MALCDNENQGIVPSPPSLGNGQRPATNLYWGAKYGVRTYLAHQASWALVQSVEGGPDSWLERVVFRGTVQRQEGRATVFIIAEAWDGRAIRAATTRCLEMAAGHHPETVELDLEGERVQITAGGNAHLLGYMGHNGFLDFIVTRKRLSQALDPRSGAPPRSALVLACGSREDFAEAITQGDSHPLLLTTGLMAPEAYTLDAVVRSWFAGESAARVREAAAAAYHRFQGVVSEQPGICSWSPGDQNREVRPLAGAYNS